VLTRKIIEKEFALSGSEQNPEFGSWRLIVKRVRQGIPDSVKAFMDKGEDFIVERELPTLVRRMNALVGGEPLLDLARVEHEIVARDRALENPYGKDAQIMAIRAARDYIGDRLVRTAKPRRLLDPTVGPLIAVRLRILTRKTLGGLQTDLDSRVIGADGEPVPGLYAAGEVAGFGGGGVHGYSALEGTFLGGCIFSGRAAGRSAAANAG
jgi:predicted oxidoreductase